MIEWQQQNPNITEEDYDLKKRHYDEQINKAADDYLNNYRGRDDAESKAAFEEYSKKVDGLTMQRDVEKA